MGDRYVLDRVIVRRLVERHSISAALLMRMTGLSRTTIYKALSPAVPAKVLVSDRVAQSLAAGLGVRVSVIATPVADLLDVSHG